MPGDVFADGVAQFVIRWLSGYGRLRSQRGMPWHRGIPLKYATALNTVNRYRDRQLLMVPTH